MYRVRVFGSRWCLRDGRRGHTIVLFVSACLYLTTTGFPVPVTICIEQISYLVFQKTKNENQLN